MVEFVPVKLMLDLTFTLTHKPTEVAITDKIFN